MHSSPLLVGKKKRDLLRSLVREQHDPWPTIMELLSSEGEGAEFGYLFKMPFERQIVAEDSDDVLSSLREGTALLVLSDVIEPDTALGALDPLGSAWVPHPHPQASTRAVVASVSLWVTQDLTHIVRKVYSLPSEPDNPRRIITYHEARNFRFPQLATSSSTSSTIPSTSSTSTSSTIPSTSTSSTSTSSTSTSTSTSSTKGESFQISVTTTSTLAPAVGGGVGGGVGDDVNTTEIRVLGGLQLAPALACSACDVVQNNALLHSQCTLCPPSKQGSIIPVASIMCPTCLGVFRVHGVSCTGCGADLSRPLEWVARARRMRRKETKRAARRSASAADGRRKRFRNPIPLSPSAVSDLSPRPRKRSKGNRRSGPPPTLTPLDPESTTTTSTGSDGVGEITTFGHIPPPPPPASAPPPGPSSLPGSAGILASVPVPRVMPRPPAPSIPAFTHSTTALLPPPSLAPGPHSLSSGPSVGAPPPVVVPAGADDDDEVPAFDIVSNALHIPKTLNKIKVSTTNGEREPLTWDSASVSVPETFLCRRLPEDDIRRQFLHIPSHVHFVLQRGRIPVFLRMQDYSLIFRFILEGFREYCNIPTFTVFPKCFDRLVGQVFILRLEKTAKGTYKPPRASRKPASNPYLRPEGHPTVPWKSTSGFRKIAYDTSIESAFRTRSDERVSYIRFRTQRDPSIWLCHVYPGTSYPSNFPPIFRFFPQRAPEPRKYAQARTPIRPDVFVAKYSLPIDPLLSVTVDPEERFYKPRQKQKKQC